MTGDMQLDEQLHLWYQAAVKIMDVRHVKMTSGEALRAYRLPSNAFIFALQGGASIALDDRDYAVNKFHLLHSGKGSYLDIKLTEDIFEYYLVLYKASIPLPTMKDKLKYIDKSNPFYMQYSFLPQLYLPLHCASGEGILVMRIIIILNIGVKGYYQCTEVPNRLLL